MARSGKAGKPKKQRWQRLKGIREAYKITKRSDPRIGWVLLAVGLLTFGVFFAIGVLFDAPVIFGFLGFTSALLAMTIVFGRRAERAAITQIEGQPGAAAAVLNAIRRGWTVTPGVGVNRNQDVVHRAVGRPGIVLIGEGQGARAAALLAGERRRHARVAGEAPITEIVVGDDTAAGQVPLKKLQRHVMKLPPVLTPGQVREVNSRLRALQQAPVAVPKGPLPRNARMPKMPRPPR